MEKAFIISEESKYFKDLEKYHQSGEEQRNFINKFFKDKGIEASDYMVSGDGIVGVPFNEHSKNDIRLYIVPTENDLKSFSKMLTKPIQRNLQSFRKNSIIVKEFAEECVDKRIVINLWHPRVSDYFKSLEYGLYGCNYTQFKYNDKLYLRVESKYLKEDDIPEGFKEIKLSEFYQAKEDLEKGEEK